MDNLRTQTALPVAKLRSIKDYCKEVKSDVAMQKLCGGLADRLERIDAIMTTNEFNRALEETLEEMDPEDYSC